MFEYPDMNYYYRKLRGSIVVTLRLLGIYLVLYSLAFACEGFSRSLLYLGSLFIGMIGAIVTLFRVKSFQKLNWILLALGISLSIFDICSTIAGLGFETSQYAISELNPLLRDSVQTYGVPLTLVFFLFSKILVSITVVGLTVEYGMARVLYKELLREFDRTQKNEIRKGVFRFNLHTKNEKLSDDTIFFLSSFILNENVVTTFIFYSFNAMVIINNIIALICQSLSQSSPSIVYLILLQIFSVIIFSSFRKRKLKL